MRKTLAVAIVATAVLVGTTCGHAQNWVIGANVGMSVLDGTAGFHITPVAEYLIDHTMGIGSEFSANTQYVSPVLWYPYFRYYIDIRDSKLKPYANLGPLFAWHLSSSPSVGILLGGGIKIPIARNFYLAPDFVLGPIFGVGGGSVAVWFANIYNTGIYNAIPYNFAPVTVFAYLIRAGIRCEL
jgi:hypothetical protein